MLLTDTVVIVKNTEEYRKIYSTIISIEYMIVSNTLVHIEESIFIWNLSF